MQITLISGSAAEKSHTYSLLKDAQALLERDGVKITFWDLRVKPLPMVMPQYHSDPIQTPDDRVKEFVSLIRLSNAIILGSPLYHGSYSGLLKNAIDNLGADDFKNKAIGLLSNAGGTRNPQALEHLRSVVRTLYGYALQTQLVTSKKDYDETPERYVLKDEEIKKRLDRLTNELLKLASVLKQHEIVKGKAA